MEQTLGTTKMSSKGQIVIPEDIRVQLGLAPGDHFVVTSVSGAIIIKRIEPPSLEDFGEWADRLVTKARVQAKESGMTEEDVKEAVRKVRGRKAGAGRS